MASAGGLTRRRGAAQAAADGEESSSGGAASPAPKSTASYHDRSPETSYSSGENGHKIAFDPRDISESEERSKQPKLTLMEEILLLGLKDKQGYLSFWNDNISYALRGCIVLELAFRGRVSMQKDSSRRRFPLPDRVIEVIDDTLTGEVLLDEALKMMKSSEKMSVSSWIDLMSGETWNLMKIGYQLKQVRERLAKGLVDKGILRTEKRNFLLFDMATHPVVDAAAKDEIRKRVRNVCSSRTVVLPPSQFLPEDLEFRYLRTVSMVCAAYAANVLENALVTMSHDARERAFAQVDELLAEYSQWPFGKRAGGAQGIGANLGQVIGQEVERNTDKELQLEMAVTPIISSAVASSSRVPAPDMEEELEEALDSCDEDAIQAVFRKIYLVGQDDNDVLRKVFEGACNEHDTDTLERIFDLDYASLPSLRPIHANGIWPQAVAESLDDDCNCVLRCLLRNGLGPHQSLGEQGDVLMWAVQCRDAYTVMHLLRGGCKPQGAKLFGKYTNIDVVAGQLWAEERDEYRDEILNTMHICRSLVELGGVTAFQGTGLLQALAGNQLCYPQSVKLARLLIDRGADVNELPPADLRYYPMSDEDHRVFNVGTALQKAVQANHQAMVDLLLARGAIPVPVKLTQT